jgi:hypothetical protein
MKPMLGLSLLLVLTAWPRTETESIDRRVRDWQPTGRERRWEQIGWARDLLSAERLAKESRRPVFLFTHDGRLNVGRC